MSEFSELKSDKLTKKRLNIAMKCSNKKLVRELAKELYKSKIDERN